MSRQLPRILVTGAGGNASRSFVASLRMALEDIYIAGCDTSPYHLQCADLQARFLVSRCDEASYLEELNALVAAEAIDFVHPQPDPEVRFLARHRDDIDAALFLPETGVVERCADKQATNQRLAAAGVPVPRSLPVESLDDMDALVSAIGTSRLWVRATRGAGSRAALPVETAAQAASWIRYWIEMKGLDAGDFMVAEFLPGSEFAFQSLWHGGELVTSMARERLEYVFGSLLPSGQSSSPSIAVTVHDEVVNRVGIAAVRAVSEKPHGVFCVDMKCGADGQPRVTEINCGRFFTTNDFFSAIGVNMPWDYVRLGLGMSVPPRPATNAAAPGLYWVRGIDRKPRLLTEDELDAVDLRSTTAGDGD